MIVKTDCETDGALVLTVSLRTREGTLGHTTLGIETGRNYTQLNVLISASLTLKLSDN